MVSTRSLVVRGPNCPTSYPHQPCAQLIRQPTKAATGHCLSCQPPEAAHLAPEATTAWCTRSPYMPLPPKEGSSPGWMLSMALGYALTRSAGMSCREWETREAGGGRSSVAWSTLVPQVPNALFSCFLGFQTPQQTLPLPRTFRYPARITKSALMSSLRALTSSAAVSPGWSPFLGMG